MSVVLTDHAKEKTENHNVPLSIVKRIVKERKGIIFYDRKEETYLFKYNKFCIVVNNEENDLIVVTVYRDSSQYRYSKFDRFVEVEHIQE